MKFEISKASDIFYSANVIINTLEDLQTLYNQYGREALIVDFDLLEITIYDDYMELE